VKLNVDEDAEFVEAATLPELLRAVERMAIQETLTLVDGRMEDAAHELGISVGRLRRLIKKHNLQVVVVEVKRGPDLEEIGMDVPKAMH
jgi:DNA-binding NtrC family response regulator